MCVDSVSAQAVTGVPLAGSGRQSHTWACVLAHTLSCWWPLTCRGGLIHPTPTPPGSERIPGVKGILRTELGKGHGRAVITTVTPIL